MGDSQLIPLGYKQTEVGVIPEEWEALPFGEVAAIRNQKTLPQFVHPDTPCIDLEHIGQGSGRLLGYSTAKESTSVKYQVRQGDILFGRLRAYLEKYWLAGFDGICTTEIWPLSARQDKCISRFVFYLVQRPEFISAASLAYGTHMPRTDWGVIRAHLVPLPPLAEQEAIAAALSDADALIEALEQFIAKKRQVKQGAMQELLTGKRRLPGFKGEWVARALEDLVGGAENIVDGPFGSNLKNSDYVDQGIPVLQGLNITGDRFTWRDVRYITEAKAKDLYRSNAQVGDLLSVKIGSVGFSAIIDNLDGNGYAIIPANLLRVRGNREIADIRFIHFILTSTAGKRTLRDLAGNTAQPAISLGGFRKLSFLMPDSIEEQTAIAAILSDMDAEIAALEEKLAKARQVKQGMMQMLLTGKVRLV